MDHPTKTSRPGVYIRTFGCQMNEYDTQKLLKVLEPSFAPVSRPEDADLVIVNTCSVRDKPEQKLYSLLGELQEHKAARGGQMLVGVGGCVAQQEGQKLVTQGRGIDFVFGTHNLSLVPALIEERRSSGRPQVAVDYRDEWEDLPLGFPEGTAVSRFVSISRGCDKQCAYCIVPTTRGREVSRSMAEIEREVRIAVHGGAREIVLLGQTVNSYGKDLNPRVRFADLLDRLSEIPNVLRLRFTSPHPQEVRDDFVELVARNPKICPHIHMPLQSGSDRILKAMNRNYRRQRYLEIIDSLRAVVPEMAITTDVIVGFPGETEGDFEQTMEILEQVKFASSYSFMFSPRPGTVAEGLPDDVPPAEKLRRLQRFQQRQDELSFQYLDSWVGREVEVLFDGPSTADASRLQGRTGQNLFVNMAAADARARPGALAKVRITARARFTLRGEMADPTDIACHGQRQESGLA